MKLDLIFECRKCGHNLYVSPDNIEFLDNPDDCPNCGEEGEQNWVYKYRGKLNDRMV